MAAPFHRARRVARRPARAGLVCRAFGAAIFTLIAPVPAIGSLGVLAALGFVYGLRLNFILRLGLV